MNSALKPVLPQPGVPQSSGQPSPAKGNVATVNHTVGHPQGAQNSLHHTSNNLVGQNLTHHAPPPPVPPHAVPSMAPVSANMAQMAQNMSHHGNLSHVTQNSVAPPTSGSPNKPTTSPLSLVQDKVNVSQPLALTRTPEKKDSDPTGHANGTIDPVKPGSTPTLLKPLNPGTNDSQNIAKNSPSTPKPPEKPTVQATSPKSDSINPVTQVDGSTPSKTVNATEPDEKSPVKPIELKPSIAADVAPSESDSKPPEMANDTHIQEKPSTPVKQDVNVPEMVKPETELKVEEKKEIDTEPPTSIEKNEEKIEELNKNDTNEKSQVEEKVEEQKIEQKPLKVEAKPKSTLKLATVTPAMRKRRQASPSKGVEGSNSVKKLSDGEGTPDTRIKRNRTKVQLYQSPTPELAMATKLSASAGRSTPTKHNADKLISFYKNEYLAVRNAEGGFYVCQAMQNVYRSTRKIKIRWLSQDKSADPSGETYKPDFYDVTEKDCVLTTLSLSRAPSGGGAQLLKAPEQARANSILQRALRAERAGAGADSINLTEEHPDGLDLSLYTDESQLEKKSRKRTSSKSSPRIKQDGADETEKDVPTPAKRARTTPKRSSKSARKAKATSTPNKQTNKRKSSGSTPPVAAASKTATAVTEKSNKTKVTPKKRTPAKQKVEKVTPRPVATPTHKGRRTTREVKSSPIMPTPSTSTGKTTRTPRKPPSKK